MYFMVGFNRFVLELNFIYGLFKDVYKIGRCYINKKKCCNC